MTDQVSITKKKPHGFWYLIALLLLIGGPILAVGVLFKGIYDVVPHHVKIQGNENIAIQKTGKYEIYAKNIPIKESSIPLGPINQSNIEIRVTDQAGKTIQIQHIQLSEKQNEQSTYPLGSVKIDQPGHYQIQINSPMPAHLEFNYSPDVLSIIFAAIKSIFIFVGSVLLGTIIALTVYIKRSTSIEIQTLNETKPYKPMERFWAMGCHLSTLFGFLIPFGNIIAPLLIWLLLRKEYYLVNDQGKESLNFQISMLIYYLIASLLLLLVVGVVLLPLLALFQFIAVIVASIEAAQGKVFRYPITIRFIK